MPRQLNRSVGSYVAASEASTGGAATDLVRVSVAPLVRAYTYRVPAHLGGLAVPGARVSVPLGKRVTSGFVTAFADDPGGDESKLKEVLGVSGAGASFDVSLLPFYQWVAAYYGEPLSSVLDVAVPAGAARRAETFVRPTEKLAGSAATGRVQKILFDRLAGTTDAVPADAVTDGLPGAADALRRMEKRGLVTIEKRRELRAPAHAGPVPEWAAGSMSLNTAQEAALAAVTAAADAPRFEAFMLHGVTGSGKTEVYIEAVRHVAAAGGGALVLVPEIALTPQLIDRFRARLGDGLAVLHSGLGRRVRWEGWEALLAGHVKLAIGARSGVFAPVKDLRLLIVDEEHEGSYKQHDGLKYHARDVAVARARSAGCPVVLGSATPSLETYRHASTGRYTPLSLPARHSGASGLTVGVVDLNRTKPWEMASKNVSAELAEEIRSTVRDGDQCFVLYNRRGFATYVQCDTCDYVEECPNCSVTLTYHKGRKGLVCHYCDFTRPVPSSCPACAAVGADAPKPGSGGDARAGKMAERGAGTERVFDELRGLFPDVAMDRLDRDAASDEVGYREILGKLRSGETKVLVGTQMIAKGHDLPGVTLVGVVDCDVGLHMPDFRAGEKVFQLLTQAAGRAGRAGKAGRVVLQTRVPRHPSIRMTVDQDYEGFARGELVVRRQLAYPPYVRLLRVVALSKAQELPSQLLVHLRSVAAGLVTQESLPVTVIGPAPAPLAKLREEWRWHLMLKSPSAKALRRVAEKLRAEKIRSTKVRAVFDVDPQDML